MTTEENGQARPNSIFNGSRASLVAAMVALLKLDAAGALVPHGIGGHARTLLQAAVKELRTDEAAEVQPKRQQKLPAWQDVLDKAEAYSREMPTVRQIRGTVFANDVPVWLADFSLRLLQRELAKSAPPRNRR